MIRFSISAVTAADRLLKKSNSQESVKNIRLSIVIVQALSMGDGRGGVGWGLSADEALSGKRYWSAWVKCFEYK